MKAVRVHCGSAHIKGAARKYPYYVASLFQTKVTPDGRLVWVNTGTNTKPRRSYKLAELEGLELAVKEGAIFIRRYGSLHNQPAGPTSLCPSTSSS